MIRTNIKKGNHNHSLGGKMSDPIESIIAKMTLEEKAALCTGASPWTTTPIEHLGVPEITVSDGPHGVRRVADVKDFVAGSLPATCFPTASCVAATWDVDLAYSMGEALAEECKALNVSIVLGPGTNMKRTPLGGRNFEYYSEDPFLAGEMAASFINGIQSKGVGASLKHYATNNQETQRMNINAVMDERTLREIYLPAFEVAVKKAKPWTVMCAYNKLNGIYGSENHKLLVDILKNEWGFEGFVVSDWGAVHDRVKALKAGLDLEMPGPRERRVKAVIEAVRAGDLDESILNESVRRILQIILKAVKTEKGGSFNKEEHHALAREIAAEGMVLLKNNGILPLKELERVAVIGRAAKEAYFQGGGSSHINPIKVDEPFLELQKVAPRGTRFSYCEGYAVDDGFHQDLLDEAVQEASDADVALLYLALPASKESEGYDRPDLDLTRQQVALIKAVSAVQANTIVVLNNGTPIVVGEWLDNVAAVLEAWMMGQAGGGAIADILYGKVNPCGKLAETFPLRLQDTPAYINFPGGAGEVCYGEGIFIGYRYYDAKEAPVQFPFGFGLSYTTFQYSSPRVSSSQFKDVDGVTVSVDVTNTGKMAGKEIVQVYVHDRKAKLVRPPKELKGFAKVALNPGETKTVSIALDFRSFAYFHPGYNQWITEDGEFDLFIGATSADIRCVETVTLQSTLQLPCILNKESTLHEWMEDPVGKKVLEPLFAPMVEQMQMTFGGGDEDKQKNGMETMNFMMELPLCDIFYFQETALPMPPEDLVENLLAQVWQQHGKG
jgi:beta-glucosidase